MTFEEFAAGKTSDAERALIPGFATEFDRAPAGMCSIGNAWTRALFGGAFYLAPIPDGRPSCSLVFVQSADGNTGAPDPSALGGGETDKDLIYEGLSRVAADAVLAGAETIRGGEGGGGGGARRRDNRLGHRGLERRGPRQFGGHRLNRRQHVLRRLRRGGFRKKS